MDPHGPIIEVVGVILTEDVFALLWNVAVPAQGLYHELHSVPEHHRPGVLNIFFDHLQQEEIIT